ncbi:hypothetical protein IC582_021482 [Cucumis melo]
MWRQGMFVIPFMIGLEITNSWEGWSITGGTIMNLAIWLWVYWDLEIFCDEPYRFFGFGEDFWNSFISLGLGCFVFGAFHVTELYGPRIWLFDPYRLTEKVQAINPT